MSNRKEYTLPNGKKAVFEYDVCGIGKITLECMDELMGMIADRPQWIPCEEGLPENFETVLITHRGGVSTGWYNGSYWERGAKTNHRKLQTVIAWMPLPQPYEGRE